MNENSRQNTTIVFELQYFHEFLFYTSVINFFLVIITIVIVVVVGKSVALQDIQDYKIDPFLQILIFTLVDLQVLDLTDHLKVL